MASSTKDCHALVLEVATATKEQLLLEGTFEHTIGCLDVTVLLLQAPTSVVRGFMPKCRMIAR